MTRSTFRGRIILCALPLFAGLGLVPIMPVMGQGAPIRPPASPASPAPVELTVDEAIRRTLDASPYRSIATARSETADAARAIAALKPQPTVELSAENFGIPINGLYDQFQITGTYSQRIERGGKRGARVALAETERAIADAELVVARLDLIKTVQLAFVEAQAEAAKLAIAQERLRVARALRQEVGRRVASARDPIFAGTRAQTRSMRRKLTWRWPSMRATRRCGAWRPCGAGSIRPGWPACRPSCSCRNPSRGRLGWIRRTKSLLRQGSPGPAPRLTWSGPMARAT